MPGAPTAPTIVEGFGTSAGASYITNPIPVPSQIGTSPGRASYTDGFVPLNATPIGSGGIPPDIRDMNGILFGISANIAQLTGGQQYTFSATFAAANGGYALGAIIAMAAGNGLWLNTVSGNSNNPDTATAATSGWVPLVGYGQATISGLTGGSLTLTAVQASTPVLSLNGTLTSNLNIALPPWLRRYRIINNTTGAFVLTVQSTAGGSSPRFTIPQFGSAGYTDVSGNGTDLQLEGYHAQGTFTATLTGVSGTVTGTMSYAIDGFTARVFGPASGLTGTSNLATMTITGLPAFLAQPTITSAQQQPCTIFVGSSTAAGSVALQVTSSVALLFYITQVSGTLVDYNSTGFPTSGTKGISGFEYAYPYL